MGQVVAGILWYFGVLLLCLFFSWLAYSGAIILAGMVFARIHLKWPLFLIGVWIGVGLTPVVIVILFFAYMRTAQWSI